VCIGVSDLGASSDRIQLRVRSRLAAVWPFLGIVVEVIILVTIIFIYEKRRKPDEIQDGKDLVIVPLFRNVTEVLSFFSSTGCLTSVGHPLHIFALRDKRSTCRNRVTFSVDVDGRSELCETWTFVVLEPT
jgi:hypothetical protein